MRLCNFVCDLLENGVIILVLRLSLLFLNIHLVLKVLRLIPEDANLLPNNIIFLNQEIPLVN